MNKKIIFICTGNTCRSPMAEGIFNVIAIQEELNVYAESYGISAYRNSPVSKFAVIAAAEYEADISKHSAKCISMESLIECYAVYCMTKHHSVMLSEMYPQYSGIIRTLSEIDISDPYGGNLNDYKNTAKAIDQAIQDMVKSMKRDKQ